MGTSTTSTTTWQNPAQEDLIVRFARIMQRQYGARVYIFGPRARGNARPDSDYDLVAVSKAFDGQRVTTRVGNRYDLWHEAGGWGVELDLHCYTPEEFQKELAGLGYLGQAKRRGELRKVDVRKAA